MTKNMILIIQSFEMHLKKIGNETNVYKIVKGIYYYLHEKCIMSVLEVGILLL